MTNRIQLKRTTAVGVVPSQASLANAEMAFNVPDGRLFIRGQRDGNPFLQEIALDRVNTIERSPQQFGVVGDGVTDDTAAITSIATWLAGDKNRKIVDRSTSVYRMSAQVLTTGHFRADWGKSKFYVTANVQPFAFDAPIIASAPATGNYVKGSTNIPVSGFNTALIPEGTWIRVISNAVDPANRDLGDQSGSNNRYVRVQEWAQVGVGSTSSNIVLQQPLKYVYGVSPTVISGEEPLIDSYTTSIGWAVYIADHSKVFEWSNGEIEFEDGHGPINKWTSAAMVVSRYFMPVVRGLRISRGYSTGIGLSGTMFALVDSCYISNLYNDTSSSQFGYGVADAGFYTTLSNSTFVNGRHAYTSGESTVFPGDFNQARFFASGRIVGSVIKDCKAFGYNTGTAPWDTHHGAEDVQFINCSAEMCNSFGFGIRGRNVKLINPRVRNCGGGINVFTEYDSGDLNDDLTLNEKSPRAFTSCYIESPEIFCSGPALRSFGSTTVISGSGRVVSSHRRLLTMMGDVRIRGDIDFVLSDMDGANPISSDDGLPAVYIENAHATAYAPAFPVSRLTVESGSRLGIDISQSQSSGGLSGGIFGAQGSETTDWQIILDGVIHVKSQDGIRLWPTNRNILNRSDNAVVIIDAPNPSTINPLTGTWGIAYMNSNGSVIEKRVRSAKFQDSISIEGAINTRTPLTMYRGDTDNLRFEVSSAAFSMVSTGKPIRIWAESTNQLELWQGSTNAMALSASGFQFNRQITGVAVTQSSTDTTVGRLVRSGDYGWGLQAGSYPAEYDFDTWQVSPSGTYWFNNTGDSGPWGLGYGVVLAMNYAAAAQIRFAINASANRAAMGYLDASGQSTWVNFLTNEYTSGDISFDSGVFFLNSTTDRVGINTTSPAVVLDVNASSIRVRSQRTPASSTASGIQGEIAWDANYIYVCTATNTWKRAPLSSW